MSDVPKNIPDRVDPFSGRREEIAWEEEVKKPFTLMRFRRAITGMAQTFFSNAENYMEDSIDRLHCLTFSLDDPAKSGLIVMAAGSKMPGVNDDSPTVLIRISGMEYTKIAIGDRGDIDSTASVQQLVKGMSGTLLIEASTPELELSTMLLEPFRDFLEGTKHIWMSGLNLQSFEVNKLVESELKKKQPEEDLKSTLVCTFTGRIEVARSVVSLPLKRIVLKAVVRTP
mgnify:FL=1